MMDVEIVFFYIKKDNQPFLAKYTKCLSTHNASFMIPWHAASAMWHFLLDTERQRAGWSAQLKEHFWKNCTTFGIKINCIKMSERETEKGVEREASYLALPTHWMREKTINSLHPIKKDFKSNSTLESARVLLNVPHTQLYIIAPCRHQRKSNNRKSFTGTSYCICTKIYNCHLLSLSSCKLVQCDLSSFMPQMKNT